MGFTKDLWTRPIKDREGKVERAKNKRWGKGKRWLAVWTDPNGEEASKAFKIQTEADRYWAAMETDRERGEYIDTKAGRMVFGELGQRWLGSRVVDPATEIHYESKYRLHVEPAFGRRQVGSIKPSEIQHWIGELSQRFETSTVLASFLVLKAVLELAVADEAIKKNPAKARVIQVPKRPVEEIEVWSDAWIFSVIERHPEPYQLIPIIAAGCGLREGEIYGLALEDIDFEEKIVRVRRQIKKLGSDFIFALPKNDRERITPLPDWVAEAIQRHIEQCPPRPYTLPWEKLSGRLRTHNILFRWTDDRHMRSRTFSELVWKPTISAVGIVPPPTKDKRGRRRYITTRKEGLHQLRHYYASVTLAGGVSIKELAEYLGHHDPGFTLRTYAHMLPCSHERARAAIDDRLGRGRPISDGTETEPGAAEERNDPQSEGDAARSPALAGA